MLTARLAPAVAQVLATESARAQVRGSAASPEAQAVPQRRFVAVHQFACVCSPLRRSSRLLAEGRIAKESLSRKSASGPILASHGRHIIEAVDGDGFVFANRNRQRPYLLALIVYVVHASSPCLICVACETYVCHAASSTIRSSCLMLSPSTNWRISRLRYSLYARLIVLLSPPRFCHSVENSTRSRLSAALSSSINAKVRLCSPSHRCWRDTSTSCASRISMSSIIPPRTIG